MKRLALIVIGLGLVGGAGLAAAGCGQEEAVPVGAVSTEISADQTVTGSATLTAPPPDETDSGTSAGSESSAASGSGVLYQVWLVRGESLFVTWRERGGHTAGGHGGNGRPPRPARHPWKPERA